MTNNADKPRGTLRKLAREATIFALLGMFVAAIGSFVKLDMADRLWARNKAAVAVHDLNALLKPGENAPFGNPPLPPGFHAISAVQVPLTDGTVLIIEPCDVFDEVAKQAGAAHNNCWKFSDTFFKKFGGQLTSVPLGSADQVAIEKSYWTAYKNSRHYGAGALWCLFFGLWGFLAGLGLWIFYRLVYFAVRG